MIKCSQEMLRRLVLYSPAHQTLRGFHSGSIGLGSKKVDVSSGTESAETDKTDKKLNKFQLVEKVATKTRLEKPKQLFKNPEVPEWKKQKVALKIKFNGEAWSPKKKLDRESMKSIRFIKANSPHITTKQLGEYFKVSPEAIRRILKSSWEPKTPEEEEEVAERWLRRGERIREMISKPSRGPPKSSASSFGLPFVSEKEERRKQELETRAPTKRHLRELKRRKHKAKRGPFDIDVL